MTGLQGKKILFCVTGSIAAFKAASWVHALVKEEAQVTVIMTRAATEFVSELTFEALAGNPVYVEMFGGSDQAAMPIFLFQGMLTSLLLLPLLPIPLPAWQTV